MRFLHISDLHLGKRFYGISFLPYQEAITEKIIDFISENKIDAVIIAGDIYDKPVPSIEAVTLFDNFLKKIYEKNVYAFIISGNHDSPERLQFGSSFMENSNIYIASVLKPEIQKVTLKDEFGNINIYMLPFFKCTNANSLFPGADYPDLNSALSAVIKNNPVNTDERNILIYHGFVFYNNKSPEISDSELGGVQLVDAEIFNDFDYTALGHIHKPQWIKKDKIRYSGCFMKYSFSEYNQEKALTVIDLKEKGNLNTEIIPISCDCDMRILKGSFEDIIKSAVYSEDLIRVELADDNKIPFAIEKLRLFYPNLLELIYLSETRSVISEGNIEIIQPEKKSLSQLMQSFYKSTYDYDISENTEEMELIEKICRKAESNI